MDRGLPVHSGNRGKDAETAIGTGILNALGNPTRREILRLLAEHERTLTGLSRIMNRSKPALHEQLRRLLEAGLVERHETNSKWVYYGLSRTGRSLAHGNPMVARFCLGLFLVMLALSLLVMRLALRSPVGIRGSRTPLWSCCLLLLVAAVCSLVVFFLARRRSHFWSQ
jgi:DNA-binding transcriptional ArsR family regulator